MDHPPEARLGKYILYEQIGSGTFATVYRAVDTVLQREVAIKILYPNLYHDRSFVQRFIREAQLAARLQHPHIIPIHDFGQEQQRLFIAMALASNSSVQQLLEQKGQLTWKEAVDIVRPICSALDHAHKNGVIHRDVKPANILIDKDWHVFLSDFGIARAVQETSQRLTTTGALLGTPLYMAPELWGGDGSATSATDIYALGCVMYEMLVGEPLFQGSSALEVMQKHFGGPELPEVWPLYVPSQLGPVLRKALASSPDARYASPMQLLEALVALPGAQISSSEMSQLDEILSILSRHKGKGKYLLYPEIKEAQIARLRAILPQLTSEDTILAFIASTWFGAVGDGMVITNKQIAWRNDALLVPAGVSRYGQLSYEQLAKADITVKGYHIYFGQGLGFNSSGNPLGSQNISQLLVDLAALIRKQYNS